MFPFAPTVTRPRFAAFLFTLALALLAVASAAAPNAAPTPAELEVAASPDCTTRADVVARVHARSPRVTFVDAGGELGIRALFSTPHAGSITAELTLVRAGAAPATRQVVARSCAEAADAVALIIAVTLDPSAAAQLEHADATATDASLSRAHGTVAKDDATAAASRLPPVAPQAAPASASTPAGESERANAAHGFGRARFGAVIAGQTFFGPTPGVMPGVALYLQAGLERSSVWSPAALVGLTHAWRSNIEEPGGIASFTLDAVSLDACLLRFRALRFELAPCASLLGGRFAARGTDTQNPVSESARPFWVLGAAGVASLRLVWRLEASARLAVGANLVRDSFEFTPVVFHTVAPVTLAASLGLGMSTP
jgi:hypothetical protein